MKKLLSVILAAVLAMSCMSVWTFAATADLVHQSVEGTAVIDGDKDDAYANGLVLSLIQKGYASSDGGLLDTPAGTVYILNDESNVYIFFEMVDAALDNTNSNDWSRDSVEIFYMKDDAQVQVRYCYDGSVTLETGDNGHAIKLTDVGYNVEVAMPITDVLNNQIEMCVQNNACTDGVRNYTVYIEGNSDGDDAYQRASRESVYDCWWTLTLAGEHEDSRTEPVVEEINTNLVLDDETYKICTEELGVICMVFTQDRVEYQWANLTPANALFGLPAVIFNANLKGELGFNPINTADYTKTPYFGIQIADNHFLQLPENATVGTRGEKGNFTFKWTDIVIKAEGYADVIVPGDEINLDFEIIQQSGYTDGNTYKIDFIEPIMTQLGLDLKAVCEEYMPNITNINAEITMTQWNGITAEEVLARSAEEQVGIDALLETIAGYQTIVDEAVKAADATDDLTALEELEATALKAYEDAKAAAVGETEAEVKAEKIGRDAADITEKIEKIKAEIAKAEAEAKAAEEAAAKAEEEAKAKTTTAVIIVAVVAVVVIAAVIVVIVLKKKK